jgi:hypothetical protein
VFKLLFDDNNPEVRDQALFTTGKIKAFMDENSFEVLTIDLHPSKLSKLKGENAGLGNSKVMESTTPIKHESKPVEEKPV